MAFGMLNSASLPIAIEFGVGSLKALQLEAGDPPSLIAAACLDTPEAMRRDHDARLTFQCENIGKLLKGAGFKGRRVICSIPAPFTLVQHIQLPRSDNVSLDEQVMGHLQSQLQCDPSRVVVRHVEVTDVVSAGGVRTEVICFAVARDLVMRIMSVLRASKMEVVGAHSEHVAIARAFDRVTRRESDKDFASLYLDLGAGTSKVAITHGREIVFAKTIHVAGVDLDSAVSKSLGCDVAEARARRLAMGRDMPKVVTQSNSSASRSMLHAAVSVGAGDRHAESFATASATDDAVEVACERRIGALTPGMTPPVSGIDPRIEQPLESPVEALASEISMCLRYHERLFPEKSVGRVIFIGGEARDRTLCQRIARLLRLPAQIGDPLACVRKTGKEPTRHVDMESPQPGWTVPFGLSFAPKNL